MIVVNPEDATSTIDVLPRYYDDLQALNTNIVITNEDTKIDLTYTLSNQDKNDGFFSFDVATNFVDNGTYRLKISDSTSGLVYYRGKIFSTTQTAQNYSVYG